MTYGEWLGIAWKKCEPKKRINVVKSELIKCEYCGEIFKKDKKRINQTEKTGKRHVCSRACASRLANQDRRCEPTTNNSANTRRDKEKFPEKDRARSLVRRAIKAGKLIPLLECEVCLSEAGTEAHHSDHSNPFLLLYLCKDCHRLADLSDDKWESLATDYTDNIARPPK